jgi:hypothetical protein
MEAFYGNKHNRGTFLPIDADQERLGREFRESTRILFSLL